MVGVSLRNQKILWGRSGNRCALCRCELTVEGSQTDPTSVIGEMCHIVAKDLEGPRGDSILSRDERNEYENLILLCPTHHKVVDDQVDTYTVEKLTELKREHELWVRTTLGYDEEKEGDDGIYSLLIDEWVKKADLDGWLAWTSHLLSWGSPSMSVKREESLLELTTWLFGRIWPGTQPELEASLDNFQRVLDDLRSLFLKHADASHGSGNVYRTRKFYKIPKWDPVRYDRLFREWEFHVDAVQDLTLELTRAANYVCDRVREFIMPSYRLQEGALVIEYGPMEDLGFYRIRPQYRGSERVAQPYPGLSEFLRIRETRDHHFGEGTEPDFG